MKNEKGYALVTVLLIITVFMIISLSFMGQAVNSVKQNQIVDVSSQSVSVAEMGVSYYQVAVKNAFLTKKLEYDNEIRTTSLTEEQIATGIVDAIKAVLPNGTKTTVDGKSDSLSDTYYIIDGVSVVNPTGIVDINFLVKGIKGTKETILNSEMSINLKDMKITYGTDIPQLPGYIGITQPTNISSACIDPPDNYDFKDGECPDGILLTKTDPEYTKNFQKFNGTVYATDSTGTLTLSGVGNKSSLKIHAPSLTLEGVQNNVTNVTIEVKEDLTFGGHFDATASSLYVGGDVNVHGKFELHDNLDKMYYTFIRGSLTLDKNQNLLIGTNNTVCVKDTVTATQMPDIKGTLFLSKGKINFPVDQSYFTNGKIKYIEDLPATEVRSHCGNTFDGPDDYIDWGEHAQTNVDKVDYN